jgi:mannose/fructose/N-acetylgalactosamine-specific phosphotransferase system component IIB
MHRYTFDIKFFASVTLTARNFKTAKKVLQEIVDVAELDIGSVNQRNQQKVLDVGLFLDDEQYPFLAEYDGVEPDEAELEIV